MKLLAPELVKRAKKVRSYEGIGFQIPVETWTIPDVFCFDPRDEYARFGPEMYRNFPGETDKSTYEALCLLMGPKGQLQDFENFRRYVSDEAATAAAQALESKHGILVLEELLTVAPKEHRVIQKVSCMRRARGVAGDEGLYILACSQRALCVPVAMLDLSNEIHLGHLYSTRALSHLGASGVPPDTLNQLPKLGKGDFIVYQSGMQFASQKQKEEKE